MPIFKIKKNADKTITFNFITEDGKHVPYKIGDKITEGGIDYKYVDNREFTVIRKQSGEYSADVNIPNTLTIDDVVYDVVAIAVSCADVVGMVGANKRIGLAVACKGDAFVGLACVDVDVACCA